MADLDDDRDIEISNDDEQDKKSHIEYHQNGSKESGISYEDYSENLD
jgi:hypothetical protein